MLRAVVGPIRKRRAALAADPGTVMDMLREGTKVARAVTEATLADVRDGLGLFRLG